jgi:ubiquinone/menaquinone biosynthesis C-methylase UbiE
MTKNYYDKYWEGDKDDHGHANNTPQWPKRELDMFYVAVEKFIGRNILDIGAGEGIFIEYLKEKNKSINRIVALEISSKAIEKGKNRNPNVDFFEGSADDTYPFGAQEFDTLFMTDVIEHLVDIDQAVSECNRILKEEGKLIIITPVFNWLKKVIIASLFWDKFFYPGNPHIRFFTKKTMDSIMEKHGFERVLYKWGLSWLGIMPQNAYFIYRKVK